MLYNDNVRSTLFCVRRTPDKSTSAGIYHGRNALLDVDPRSIQHYPLSRQESFEHNDRSQDYELHERPAASSAYNTYYHIIKKANIIVTQGDDEEDGDWC